MPQGANPNHGRIVDHVIVFRGNDQNLMIALLQFPFEGIDAPRDTPDMRKTGVGQHGNSHTIHRPC